MLEAGVSIAAVDSDDEYLGLEVFVSSPRYAGSTFIFAAHDDLARFADCLTGFPAAPHEERTFQLGTKETGYASGFAGFHFHTVGELGKVAVDVEIVDTLLRYSAAQATFSLPVEAAGVDRFVQSLRVVQSNRAGVARLPGSS